MRCDTARRVLSDQLDEPVEPDTSAAAEAHVATCTACDDFETHLATVRRQLRLSPLEPPPDIAGAVRARLEREPRRRWPVERGPMLARAAAVFVLAFALGAGAVGLPGPRRVEAYELVQLVRAGQHRLDALQARVTVVEHGWHPQVPERRYTGRLVYEAPETLVLRLDDRTRYPAPAWRGNDVTVVVDDDTAWSRGRVGCPVSALPDCAPDERRTTVVTGREPFDATESVPLDLVVPVDSFATAATTQGTRTRTVDGRPAVEVTVTVAQLQPLLDGVMTVGAWRSLHPTDTATVALDAAYGIPLHVEITATPSAERDRWAATLGYHDAPAATLWTWHLTDLAVNPTDVAPPPRPPEHPDVSVDRGFRADGADLPQLVTRLHETMSTHRAGRADDVVVHSWSDGSAWLRVRAHPSWDRDRLFGHDDGRLVRRVALASGGVGYVVEGGDRVFVHAADADVEIAGSLGADRLRAVADRLQVTGLPVPRDWTERSSATLEQARRELPGLLVANLADFAGPGVRVTATAVTLSYVGNGDRGFALTQTPGQVLTPPLDDVVVGVPVRGTTGRHTPRTGTLEWVEDDRTVTLRSATLSLQELRTVAARLEALP